MAGGTFSYTFTEAGQYEYFCSIHPWMTGTIIVN
jgi:plastocyanin